MGDWISAVVSRQQRGQAIQIFNQTRQNKINQTGIFIFHNERIYSLHIFSVCSKGRWIVQTSKKICWQDLIFFRTWHWEKSIFGYPIFSEICENLCWLSWRQKFGGHFPLINVLRILLLILLLPMHLSGIYFRWRRQDFFRGGGGTPRPLKGSHWKLVGPNLLVATSHEIKKKFSQLVD